MDKNTIVQLNNLNQQFYQKIAADFSETRSQAWTGWEQLIPIIKKLAETKTLTTYLDIGCGNGRWANFLYQHFGQTFTYYGLDNNQQLLDIAQEQLIKLNINFELTQVDLVKQLLNSESFINSVIPKPDVITVFGVLHHLPSQQLRIKFLTQLASLLTPDSLLVMTAWQFADDPKIKNKIVDPQILNIQTNQLEPNDYILDWQRGETAYRYCHHLVQTEIDVLLNSSNLELISTFQADGKSNQLNRYLIAKIKLPVRV
jgi:SAM-dependent methyltransferase